MFRASGIIPTNVTDPLQEAKAEVKSLLLVGADHGESFDACIAVTGKELV